MSGRRWSALLVVVAFAAVVLLLRPCRSGDDGRRPDTDAPRTSEAGPSAPGADEPARRRATPADAPPVDSAPPPAAASTTSVVVRVVAADGGEPVAGADVLLFEETDDKEDVERRAKTDDAGVARFVGLPPCTAMVRAWADDFVRSDFTGAAAKPGEEPTLVVRLDRGAPLDGVVRDARSGRPIAGAKVDVELGGSIEGIGSSGTSAPHLGLLTTGEDGRFRLRVPPDEMVTPTASARGFVPSGRTVIVHRGETSRAPLELRLDAGGTLRGTVRGSNGAAVPGARVYAVPADQRELLANPDGAVSGGGRRWTALVATTDAAGRYEIDGLTRGGVYVAFAAADGWARSAAVERVLVTDSGPSADADFALRKSATLVVRVVDADGEPHEGRVSIETSRDETFRHHPQEVDEGGATRFEDIDPGRYRVAVQSNTAPAESGSADVADGATVEFTVRLPRGVAISGTVVDDLGKPVAHAGVNASGARSRVDPTAPVSFGHGETRADGTFVVEGLREEPHTLRTYADLHADTDHGTIDAPAKDVRFVLPRTAKATLRLVAPRGVPPPAEILVRGEIRTTPSPGAAETWSAGGAEPQPFGDGRVVVPALAPGPCRVRVMSTEFAPIVRQFDAKPGETIDLGEATLDPGVDVAGRVEDAAGTPVAGARVTVGGVYAGDTVSPDVRMTSSGPDGTFRLARLATGPLEVAVAAPEFVSTTMRVEVAPGGGTVVVRLFRGALVTATVVDAAGAPVPGASVVVRAANAASDAATNRADHRGVAEFRVAAGKIRVGVEDKDAAADVDLVEGGETSVRLVVK